MREKGKREGMVGRGNRGEKGAVGMEERSEGGRKGRDKGRWREERSEGEVMG